MDPTMSAVCFEHGDRPGTPCARCGTFRCAECLAAAGVCVNCATAVAARPPAQGEAVGFQARVFPRLIDSALHLVMALLGGMAAGVALAVLAKQGLVDTGWLERLKLSLGPRLAVSVSTTLASTAVMNRVSGTSVGKWLFRQRLVRIDGTRPRLLDGVVRELGLYIDLLFFGAVGYVTMKDSPLRQRVGDKWANTVVVRADTVSLAGRASPTELVVGLSLGVVLKAGLTAALLFWLVK